MKTRITELLGIEYPIIQAGMTFVSYVPLVVAVSEAGGLGIMTCSDQAPEEVRANIRKIRELTDKPFGVNMVPYTPGYKDFCKVILEEEVPVFSHGLGNPFKLLGVKKPPGMIFMPTVGSVKQAKVITLQLFHLLQQTLLVLKLLVLLFIHTTMKKQHQVLVDMRLEKLWLFLEKDVLMFR